MLVPVWPLCVPSCNPPLKERIVLLGLEGYIDAWESLPDRALNLSLSRTPVAGVVLHVDLVLRSCRDLVVCKAGL